MKILETTPPNYEDIKKVLTPPETAVFAYGDTIYNPSKQKIWPDLEEHEKVHQRQQGDNPDLWWRKYLSLPSYRRECEVQAYARQFIFWKEKTSLNNKELKNILYEMANALSSDYGLDLSYNEAETLIRKQTKEYAKTRV